MTRIIEKDELSLGTAAATQSANWMFALRRESMCLGGSISLRISGLVAERLKVWEYSDVKAH